MVEVKEEMLSYMEDITLSHMALKIDIDHVLTENYPGAEKDFCIYMVQQYYLKYLEKIGPNPSGKLKKKALTYAKWFATKRFTTELKSLVDSSAAYMLIDAVQTGWFHDMEMDDLDELLASIYEGKEGRTEAYDWKFIIERLVPAARHAHIDPGVLTGASLQIKKLRGVVPAARELFERQDNNKITREEAETTLLGWMETIADPKVTYDSFHEGIDEWRGKSVHRDGPIKGYKVMLPGGNFCVVIPTKNDKELAVLEQALKNRSDLALTGFDWLTNLVLGKLKVNRNGGVKQFESEGEVA